MGRAREGGRPPPAPTPHPGRQVCPTPSALLYCCPLAPWLPAEGTVRQSPTVLPRVRRSGEANRTGGTQRLPVGAQQHRGGGTVPVGPGQPVWGSPGDHGRTLPENGSSSPSTGDCSPPTAFDLLGAARPHAAPRGEEGSCRQRHSAPTGAVCFHRTPFPALSCVRRGHCGGWGGASVRTRSAFLCHLN